MACAGWFPMLFVAVSVADEVVGCPQIFDRVACSDLPAVGAVVPQFARFILDFYSTTVSYCYTAVWYAQVFLV